MLKATCYFRECFVCLCCVCLRQLIGNPSSAFDSITGSVLVDLVGELNVGDAGDNCWNVVQLLTGSVARWVAAASPLVFAICLQQSMTWLTRPMLFSNVCTPTVHQSALGF